MSVLASTIIAVAPPLVAAVAPAVLLGASWEHLEASWSHLPASSSHLGIYFESGVSYPQWRAASIAITLPRRMTRAIASTMTASITIVMLDALLNLASWARLRRRPPPAGAAFGRKFADNRFCLPSQQRQLRKPYEKRKVSNPR